LNSATRHQIIWFYDKQSEKFILKLPNVINSDVGYQLMFGESEDYRTERSRIDINNQNNEVNIYADKKIYNY
tara:strand:- start:1163 stop:1378 length:216 start_codon:yes stop_codon:yes gene_type:complete